MDPLDFNQLTILPLLTLNENNTDFDYAAYLQDEDVDYLGDAGSSGSASVLNEVVRTSVSPPTSATFKSNSKRKTRLERKGHTKSRGGCYNCKRRRIKVDFPSYDWYSKSLLKLRPLVSRVSTVVWALRQDKSQVRVSSRSPGHASS
jgi:hypothetical protein